MDPKTLLYPRTKFEVLRTLYFANAPVPLREIAYRSNVIVGSAQTALKVLLKEKIISRESLNNRTYYRLHNPHVQELLAKVLHVLEPAQLQEQIESTQRRAIHLLPQLEERNNIITRARQSLPS